MHIDTDKVRAIIFDIAAAVEEQKQHLSDLDQAIGDGDHGFNMARGFGAVAQKLKDAPGADIGEVLKTVAMTLISNVGGASGPLYGSLFLKASTAAKGLTEIDLQGFVALFEAGVLGVQALGKAKLDDKTMLDVLLPALDSFKNDDAARRSLKDAFANAEKVAAAGMEKTRNIIAKKGRASYLGERSIGHIDPGAASSHLMISVVSKALA